MIVYRSDSGLEWSAVCMNVFRSDSGLEWSALCMYECVSE